MTLINNSFLPEVSIYIATVFGVMACGLKFETNAILHMIGCIYDADEEFGTSFKSTTMRRYDMATILVDYENVCFNNGLKGAEYLDANDTLIIFYSVTCAKIKRDYMDSIESSGCGFQVCKLMHTGKNALDFYIAAECGALFEKGERQIAIVSNDKGFSAVVDFLHIKSDQSINAVTASNIENALLALGGRFRSWKTRVDQGENKDA